MSQKLGPSSTCRLIGSSGLIGSGMTTGMELNEDSVGVWKVDGRPGMRFVDRGKHDAEAIKVVTPVFEMVPSANAQGNGGESAEGKSAFGLEMQSQRDSATMLQDDADQHFRFLEVQDWFEPQRVHVPVAASEHVRDGQSHMVDTNE